MDFDLARELAVTSDSKIVLYVVDGLGGLPHPDTGRTELEAADTPHLDRLAAEGICGLTVPVGPGITPGSGPGHLSLFGYDPYRYQVGRGVLEALGIDFDLQPQDVAARGNFCTVDGAGRVSDRRAGRISTDTCTELCDLLREIKLPKVELFVEPVREHRFLLVLRAPGLDDHLSETDPQRLGVKPPPVQALAPEAKATASSANKFIAEARRILADHHPANMLLLRGFSKHPSLPHFGDIFRMRAAAVAVYPMYRGLAKLVGMTVLPTGVTLEDELETLRKHWEEFDFFFLHYKRADAAGEDGDFEGKMGALEAADAIIPALREMGPDVLMVAGDHSTPSTLAAHSWHPVPFVLHSRWCRADRTEEFNELSCMAGALGTFPATDVMPLAMAHARRLAKYGA
jgi:2,3-bisphosphoglycerate-independent phosphoglycerate mutase